MTGAYVRIRRNEKIVTVEAEDLTSSEFETFFKDMTKDEIKAWLKMSLKTLKNIKDLDLFE